MSMSRRQFLARTALASGALTLLPLDSRTTAALPDTEVLIPEPRLEHLRTAIHGRVIVPGGAEYDRARRVVSFNPLTDKYPALIVRCADPTDVVHAVDFARNNELEIAVRSGGNDVLGESVCQEGLLIDLSPMKVLEIDPER